MANKRRFGSTKTTIAATLAYQAVKSSTSGLPKRSSGSVPGMAVPRSGLNGLLQEGMIPLSPLLELNNVPRKARRCA